MHEILHDHVTPMPLPAKWGFNFLAKWLWIHDKEIMHNSPFHFNPCAYVLRSAVAGVVMAIVLGPIGIGLIFIIDTQSTISLYGAVAFKATFGFVCGACAGPLTALSTIFSFFEHYEACFEAALLPGHQIGGTTSKNSHRPHFSSQESIDSWPKYNRAEFSPPSSLQSRKSDGGVLSSPPSDGSSLPDSSLIHHFDAPH
jgi:hypothetical protein